MLWQRKNSSAWQLLPLPFGRSSLTRLEKLGFAEPTRPFRQSAIRYVVYGMRLWVASVHHKNRTFSALIRSNVASCPLSCQSFSGNVWYRLRCIISVHGLAAGVWGKGDQRCAHLPGTLGWTFDCVLWASLYKTFVKITWWQPGWQALKGGRQTWQYQVKVQWSFRSGRIRCSCKAWWSTKIFDN